MRVRSALGRRERGPVIEGDHVEPVVADPASGYLAATEESTGGGGQRRIGRAGGSGIGTPLRLRNRVRLERVEIGEMRHVAEPETPADAVQPGPVDDADV